MDFDKPKVYGDTFISDGLVKKCTAEIFKNSNLLNWTLGLAKSAKSLDKGLILKGLKLNKIHLF